jgi:hypothetical protein
MFKVEWDSKSVAQAKAFTDFRGDWEYMLEHTAKDLAEYAKTYFEPMLEGVRPSPKGNGDTKQSITYDISQHGTGFEVTYNGLLSAYYLDVGNFPASSVLTASQFGMKMFPVDKRFGVPFPAKEIHGMGHYTSGVPNHWSEETVRHMSDDDVAFEIAEKWMNVFLDEVVIR